MSRATAALVAVLLPSCLSLVAADPIDLDTLRQLRAEAAHRQRRIIFNNDGDDVIYTKKEPTAEALLALRTTPLLGSQVDSIFYSNSLCFGHALHRSEVMEPFTNTADMFADNGLPQLLERGLDPIAVMAQFGREHGIEVFWDMRMNDTHDAMIGGYGPPLRPTLKLRHPEYLVGAADKQPPHGTWSSVDYAVPEVRELCYRFFEEVCQKFDVDGVEMDFFRHACFLRSVAWGGRAGEEELAMMTDLMRRIRAMTEVEGMRRGRPILIAIRVPDSVEYCRGIGLDVEAWLREGLVDILSGTCYFRLNPWSTLIELGHRYGVPVYPSLSDSRVQGQARFQRNSLESIRARALQAWDAGADGIYVFNYFNPRGPIWHELGDPAELRTRDKLYFVTNRDGNPQTYLAGGAEYQTVPILTPNRPWAVPADEPVETVLAMGEDPAAAAARNLDMTVTCHVRLLGGDDLTVSFNGKALEPPTRVDDWLDFAVPPDYLQRGANRIALQARAVAADPAAEVWAETYEAGELPAAPWQKMGFGPGTVAEIQDGKLLIADRSTEGGSYAFFQYPCFIQPADETVLQVRLKQLAGWSSVMFENGTSGEEVQFYPDRVVARHSGLSHAMDTTDGFHTYRVAMQGESFRVYADGALILDGEGKFTRPAWNGRSGVMFGASNSPGVGEGLWEWVGVRNRAVTMTDLAVSVKYAAR